MTQKTLWAATIAPIGVPGCAGRTIANDCVVTVHDGAPLLGVSGVPIGLVESIFAVDGHLVATGTLEPGQDIPSALPTFDVSIVDAIVDGQHSGTTTFHTLTITAVRADFEITPEWSDPEIRFVRDWCVHVLGPDDLIAMPDNASAVRAVDRFNSWWKDYRSRCREHGLDLPDAPAVVRPWPYDPDEHAKALASLRADDPDGWLSY